MFHQVSAGACRMSNPLPDDVYDCYIEAGKVASVILRDGAGMIREGVFVLDVVEAMESMVSDAGAGLAFPLNLSINEDAAHDTGSTSDERVFTGGDIVKLDLGVHLDGYIADTALTVDLGDHALLIEASQQALASAITIVKPGISIGEIGTTIQKEIEARGFRPVSNLTGHGLGRYAIHTPPSIPNIGFPGGMRLEEGMVFAIEPFASSGSGRVNEKSRTEIFQQTGMKPVRLLSARKIISSIRERRGMPFARRWLPDEKRDFALTTLIQQGIVRAYPVLADIPGSLVSQHEHTLIVTDDGCIVTTA